MITINYLECNGLNVTVASHEFPGTDYISEGHVAHNIPFVSCDQIVSLCGP